MPTRTTRPREFDDVLSDYGPCSYDASCGEPVRWGFRIKTRLGQDRLAQLSQYGEIKFIGGAWFVVTKTLTRAAARKAYGECKGDEYGPKGGWKSVTFGDKRFATELFKRARKPYRETRDGTVCNGIRYDRKGNPVGTE
jgi:hypothetical protein